MTARIKKDDIVIATAGKERFSQKTGKVLKVLKAEGKVVVQGFNFVKRHTRPSAKSQQGGILEKEAPISIANIMLYCGHCKRGVRVGIKVLEDKSKSRVCRRCGESLDKI